MGIARPGILSYHANALESLAELEQVVRGGVPPPPSATTYGEVSWARGWKAAMASISIKYSSRASPLPLNPHGRELGCLE